MLKIGNVELENNVILAPMAGVCNPSFRILAKEMGAGLVCAEMVATKALQHGNARTRSMLKILGEEKPVAMQLVGCDAESMAIAAELVAETEADIIDINMGCPASKIHKAGSGAALARDPESAGRIIEAVVKAAGNKPVTVKFRKGWDDDNINAVAIAKIAEQAGAKSVAVHGRTAKQMYTGHADWDIIKAVKAAVNINVIGNGDITSPQKAVEMLKHTGADGVMIGRGSLGNPWIFKQVAQVMWSAVDGSVRATTPATRRPRPAPGSTTTAAAASENSAWATTCSRSAWAGWTCRLVSSQQSSTAGRARAVTKSLTAARPGTAA